MITYLFLEKKTNDEINTQLIYVYGDRASLILTTKYWTAAFKRGRASIFDHDCSGNSLIDTPEMITSICTLCMDS